METVAEWLGDSLQNWYMRVQISSVSPNYYEVKMKIISNLILFPIYIVFMFFSTVFIILPNLVYEEIVDIITVYNGSMWEKFKYEWSLIKSCQKINWK